MYQDNTLLPREAIRLAALGALATTPMSYGALALDIRNFASRVAGPSLELMGASVEVLRHEGLIELVDDTEDGNADSSLCLTDAGREELLALLRSAIRTPFTDINKLVLALKFRFLHLLSEGDQQLQVEMMIDACEGEIARLIDLRGQHESVAGYLPEWLDHDIGLAETRLEWLRDFAVRLNQDG
ncbi:MAG: hypothetical protein V3R85_04695 [Alphaproteobacteria bacterium]